MRRMMPRGTTVNDDWDDDGADHHYCTMRLTRHGNGNGTGVFHDFYYPSGNGNLEGFVILFRAGPVLPRGSGAFFFGRVLYRIRRGIWEVKAGHHLLRRNGVAGFGFLVFWGHGRLRAVDRQDGGSGNPHAARYYAWQ